MTGACGTYAGWNRHVSRDEPPCDPCREAQRAYMREWRKRSPEKQAVRLARQAARYRAFTRLADENRARFYELVNEELTKAGDT